MPFSIVRWRLPTRSRELILLPDLRRIHQLIIYVATACLLGACVTTSPTQSNKTNDVQGGTPLQPLQPDLTDRATGPVKSIVQEPIRQSPPSAQPGNQANDFKSAGQQSIDFWQVMQDGFAIPALNMPSVDALNRLYASNPDFLSRALQRSAPYIHEIIVTLKQRGLPTDLALLPVIESGYDPGAISPAAAAGIWQFIPSTGRRFGLKQDWLRDERRDPLAATTAALDYLQTLFNMFGNWHLALAAYNCGESCVSRAIQKSQSINGGRDFASIARFLPQETRDYVPRFIAVRNVFGNSRANGVRLPAIHNNARITSIFINQPVDLQSIARLSGTSYGELAVLNAGVLRQAIPSTSSLIWLPETALAKLKKSIADSQRKDEAILLMNLKPVTAQPGESLKSFAARQSITIEQLRSTNNIPSSLHNINSGTLFVPKRTDEAMFQGDISRLAPLKMVGEEALRRNLANKNDKLLATHPKVIGNSGWVPGRLKLIGRSRNRKK